ncbi:unnamed protein product, partial [Rotaria sp. Silwood2]
MVYRLKPVYTGKTDLP